MIYLELFISYLKIGFFGFGGGYTMLSLLQLEVVTSRGWITNTELTDIVAISQMTPGPIAINSATYIGYTVTGNIWGAIIATFAVCLPSLTIMLFLTRFYLKLNKNPYISGILNGMKPMMIGMIFASGLLMLNTSTMIDYKSWILLVAAFIGSWFKVSPILLIILSGAAGVILYS